MKTGEAAGQAVIPAWKQALARQKEAFVDLARSDASLAVQAVWYPVAHEARPSPKSPVFEAKSKKLAVIGSCEFVAQNSGLPIPNGTDPEGSILLQYLGAKVDARDKEELLAWRAIAEKAASAVAGVPVAMLRDLGFSNIPRDADDWTYLMFLLAWRNRRGWTLKAYQTAETPAGVTAKRKLGEQYFLWKMLLGDDPKAIQLTPWFSFLPDLIEASIGAIDIVMEYTPQYEQTRPMPVVISPTAEETAGISKKQKPTVNDAAAQGHGGTERGKQRGRKKAGYETVEREAKTAEKWNKARDSGIYKADFAKGKKMPLKELDLLLDRVAARNRRSD